MAKTKQKYNKKKKATLRKPLAPPGKRHATKKDYRRINYCKEYCRCKPGDFEDFFLGRG